MEVKYFGEASELHVHLLNIDLFPWSFGPILYTGLTQRGKKKHLIYDSQINCCPPAARNLLYLHGMEFPACGYLQCGNHLCNVRSLFMKSERSKNEFCASNIYLHKDDHVPDCFDQYDVRATLVQLLVVWETDLKQDSCVLQPLHFCLHHCDGSIRLSTETF